MKLLLDQNISRRLANHLADVFPDARHVATLGLDRASDDEVFDPKYEELLGNAWAEIRDPQ